MMTAVPAPGEWTSKALCRGMDPNPWFPQRVQSETVWEPVKRVCRECPVVGECREYAIEWEPEHGMWGAMSPVERQRERRRRARERKRAS